MSEPMTPERAMNVLRRMSHPGIISFPPPTEDVDAVRYAIAEIARLQAEVAALRKRCDDTREMIGTWLFNIHSEAASFDRMIVVGSLERLHSGLTLDAAIDAARRG